MKKTKEITIKYLENIQEDLFTTLLMTDLDRRNQSIVNMQHKLRTISRAIKIVEESEELK